MSIPIISPDGQWMWTGTEWIPAPPLQTGQTKVEVNMRDSVLSGNLRVKGVDNRVQINIFDSVITGGIDITPEVIKVIENEANSRMDKYIPQILSKASEFTAQAQKQIDEVFEVASVLEQRNMVMNSSTYNRMVNTATLLGKTQAARKNLMLQLYSAAIEQIEGEYEAGEGGYIEFYHELLEDEQWVEEVRPHIHDEFVSKMESAGFLDSSFNPSGQYARFGEWEYVFEWEPNCRYFHGRVLADAEENFEEWISQIQMRLNAAIAGGYREAEFDATKIPTNHILRQGLINYFTDAGFILEEHDGIGPMGDIEIGHSWHFSW
tara:strand:- start:1103 stop:2065 length:963 start_codon:yes stop_codon:yes gene_type:complete